MKNVFRVSFAVMALLKLLAPFLTVDLTVPLFGSGLLILLSSVSLMGKSFKAMTIGFLCCGGGLLAYEGQPFSVWVAGTESMTNVIAILAIMQLFVIPIGAGHYDGIIGYWLRKSFRGEPGLFLFTTLITHVFSSFLLFGTVPVMVSLFEQSLKRCVTCYERFISTAVARGYALVVLWAPGAVNLYLVIQATGVGWSELFLPGLVLAIAGILTSYFMEKRTVLSPALQGSAIPGERLDDRDVHAKTVHVALVVTSLILFTFFFEKTGFSTPSNRIQLAGFIVVSAWLAGTCRQSNFPAAIREYWRTDMLKALDLAPLFLSMGLFSTALEKAGLFAYIQPYLQQAANAAGPLSLALVPVVVIGCALIGIHPFISIVMFGHMLGSINLPAAPVSVALCLSVGGGLAYIVSPFAGIVLTLAKFVNCRVTDIGFRWNGRFCLIFLGEGVLFAYIWGWLVAFR